MERKLKGLIWKTNPIYKDKAINDELKKHH